MNNLIKAQIINIYHILYNIARYSYRFAKGMAKKLFYKYNSSPYENISLYPHDLQIEIIDKDYLPNNEFPKYTTITPVLNEEKSIINMLKSLEEQTLLPDQVVIVDAGSIDATIANINEYKENSKLDILLLSSTVKNIAFQRNIAIDHARNNLLVNVDAGTILDKNYAANVIGPFYENKDLDLVSGVHHAKTKYKWSVYFSPRKHFELNLEPYGACLAYRKDIATKIGKYPEYLTYAGEDTFFCYKYKKESKKWVFNRNAFILWEHPSTFADAKKKLYNYMIANFEIGLWVYYYYSYFFEPRILQRSMSYSIFKKNYLQFLQRQAEVEIQRRKIKGLCFVITDSYIYENEGNKAKEIVTEFITNNYKVFYLNVSKKLPARDKLHNGFINIDHSLLEFMHYKHVTTDLFENRYGEFLKNSIFVVQQLDREILDRILVIKRFTGNSIVIVYDCLNKISDFSEVEKSLIQQSNWIIATEEFVDFLQKPEYEEINLSIRDKLLVVNNPLERTRKLLELSDAKNNVK
jgi:glycosyltransferase involved in cell wall biosynthesis